MPLELWDVQASVSFDTTRREVVELERLREVLSPMGVTRAVARILPLDFETDVVRGNERLYELSARSGGWLCPCPVILPNTLGDLPSEEEQVARAAAAGAGAMWIRPEHDHWFIADWLSDRLFTAMTERRMPLMLSTLGLKVPSPQVAELAGRFPELPIILADLGYRDQRTLLPMMQRFANVHLSLGISYVVHAGIEQLVEQVGSDRLLWGSGFYPAEPAAAMTQLTYADISDVARRQIASGNLRRLMEGIRV
jgi:hypothetical protein